MDRLTLLAQDKLTMADLRVYLQGHLEKKLLEKAFQKKPIEGYAEANEIIKVALNELEALVKPKNKNNLDQAE